MLGPTSASRSECDRDGDHGVAPARRCVCPRRGCDALLAAEAAHGLVDAALQRRLRGGADLLLPRACSAPHCCCPAARRGAAALGDYLTIAEDLAAHGAHVVSDLRQLWFRIAVGIALHNTDDHLRNHGLLRDRAGWRLAPAFDINPEPNIATRHATALAGRDDADGMAQQLIEQSAVFSLRPDDAVTACRSVVEIVRGWREVAASLGASASEIARFADAIDAGVSALHAVSH